MRSNYPLDTQVVPRRYAEISVSSAVQVIGASVFFLGVLSLGAWGIASAVPMWLKFVLGTAILLAALPVAIVMLNYRRAVNAVASLVADMIDGRKDRHEIEKLRLQAEIAELRARPQVQVIQPVPVAGTAMRYEPETPIAPAEDVSAGQPMLRFYKDTDIDVRDLAYFVEQVCTEGLTVRVWLTKPVRRMPSGLEINEFEDFNQFMEILVEMGWVIGRNGEKRQPGKLVTRNAEEIKKGLRLPPEFWGTDWRRQLPKEFQMPRDAAVSTVSSRKTSTRAATPPPPG